MGDIQKRITEIEKEIRETPYHKGTEHHIGLLRARLAKLKDQLLESGVKKGGGGGGFAIKKHGAATVVLVGFPSVGKSTLLNALTNARSPTAEYAFTTVTVIPGMMKYKGASIQILDVPGLIEGAASGKGRGREVLSVIRAADLLLIIAEAGHEEHFNQMKLELHSNGVRINEDKPKVEIRKSSSGGLRINSSVKQDLDRRTIEDICKEFRITNAEVLIKEKVSMNRLIDSLSTNRVFVPALFVINKVDLARGKKVQSEALPISAKTGFGLNELKEAIWDKLQLVRIFLKKPGRDVDYDEPIIMHRGNTLQDTLAKLGPEAAEGKKEAKIWGKGARFPGQTVSLSTHVQDAMEVMFI